MGLDNYWVGEKGEDGKWKTAAVPGKFDVVGGMFSGHGNDSFRGKAYATLVENVTGQSLYDDYISPEKVREMAAAIESVSFEEWLCGVYIDGPLSPEDRKWERKAMADFKRMWRAHAKAGHGLVSWY